MTLNHIYQGEAAFIMKKFPAAWVDLVVTSPPYDNLRSYQGYTFNWMDIAQALYRVVKRGGVVIWVVADATVAGSETGTSFRQALGFMESGFHLHDTMIYRKLTYHPLTHNRYEQEWEYMFCFSKGKPKTFNPILIPCKYAGQKTWGKPTVYTEPSGRLTPIHQYVIKPQKIRGNVFEYRTGSTTGTAKIKHPAMFPAELAKDQILSWSNEGDTVLDPMCGSGTTLEVARKYGRHYVGIEISQAYVAIARNRVQQARLR
jgi:site-specific DNA-methyltransferase (adenine-specific)